MAVLAVLFLALAVPVFSFPHTRQDDCTPVWTPYTDMTDSSWFLDETNWERPVGSNEFVPAVRETTAEELEAGRTVYTQCRSNIPPYAVRAADYQSKYWKWGGGRPLQVSFWYAVQDGDAQNFRLQLLKVPGSGGPPVLLWQTTTVSQNWVRVEVDISDSNSFALRFSAKHPCSTSVAVHDVSVNVDMSPCHDHLPSPAALPSRTTAPPTKRPRPATQPKPTRAPVTWPSKPTATTTTTTTTTTEVPYPAPFLDIHVKELRIPENHKCDKTIMWSQTNGKCDPMLTITYKWIDHATSENKEVVQKVKERTNDHNVFYPETVGQSIRADKNSVVRVEVLVEDHDPLGKREFIGMFEFSYVVPENPQGQTLLVVTQDAAEGGIGTMDVQFRAVFPQIAA